MSRDVFNAFRTFIVDASRCLPGGPHIKSITVSKDIARRLAWEFGQQGAPVPIDASEPFEKMEILGVLIIVEPSQP